MTDDDVRCRHCGAAIRYRAARGWVHVLTDSTVCAGMKRTAEPERKR